MAKISLNLTKSDKEDYTKKQHYESSYGHWRNYRSDLDMPFMMVPVEILDYTSSIKSKALNLYIYYCRRANNKTGKSWPAIETTATDLDVSTKSVNNWNSELESLGLIARINEGHNSKTTYLLPISSYSYFEKKVSPIQFAEVSEEKIDGNLVAVFHLFQWRKEGQTDQYIVPYNVTCLVFQRRYSVNELNKEFLITKAVLFEEEDNRADRVDKAPEDFSEDTVAYLFDTKKTGYPLEIPIKGIAVTSKINLKGAKKSNEVIDFIEQLTTALDEGTLENLPHAKIIE